MLLFHLTSICGCGGTGRRARFLISYIGLIIGKKFGTRLSGKASILGGIILIAIGAEIFLEGIF